MIAPAFHIRDDDFQSLVDDPIDAVVDDEQAEVEVGRIRQGATEQAPAAITGEHEGVEARVGKLCSNAEPEASAHRRPIVGRVEGNVGVGSLGHVLTILVGDADVVEPDAVRPPQRGQRLVEGDEIDATVADVPGDLSSVQALGQLNRRAPADAAAGEPRNQLAEDGVEVATYNAVIAAHAVTELTGDVAVLLGPSGEVPELSSGNGRQVERVLARIEAERDDTVVGTDASPELHGLVVSAEGDVSEAVAILGGNGVRAVDRPDGRCLHQLRQPGGERGHARPAGGLAADIDHNASPVRDPGKVLDEPFDVLGTKAALPRLRGDIDVHGLRQDVRVEGDGDRPRLHQNGLRPLQLFLHGVDVVDDDAALSQLRLELRDDVHAVNGHVLERGLSDRHRRVERDEIDRWDVVQLGVGEATSAQLGCGASRGNTAADPAGGEVVAERHEAGDVFAHRQQARRAVGCLRRVAQRLEVLGDMDQPATIDARIGGDAPTTERLDQPKVATGPFQGHWFKGREFVLNPVDHAGTHGCDAPQPLNMRLIDSVTS